MQPLLIISGTFEKRKIKAASFIKAADPKLLRPNHPDLLILTTDTSLGIEEIRRFQKDLSFKPFQAKLKAAVIPQAEKLTIPAQNAFLKTLEEPPPTSLIILSAPTKDTLLPTVVSRCRLVTLPADTAAAPDPTTVELLAGILTGGVGERLKIAEAYKNREAALDLVGRLLIIWRHLLLAKSNAASDPPLSASSASHLELILSRLNLAHISAGARNTEKARRLLEANVNPQLTLDNLFLDYPTSAKSQSSKVFK